MISLSFNISSLWPFFEDRKDAVLLFMAYVERFYGNFVEGEVDLAVELEGNFNYAFMEILNSGFFSEFILKDLPQKRFLKTLLILNPTALVLPSLSCYEEILPQFKTYRKPKPLIIDSGEVFRPNIKVKVVIEPDIDKVKACSLTGCDEVVFKALPLDANQIEKYNYLSRIAVDLGMGVGIEEGFDVDELESIFKESPYINTLYLGKIFFSMAIFEGLENTLKTYLKLIEKYS